MFDMAEFLMRARLSPNITYILIRHGDKAQRCFAQGMFMAAAVEILDGGQQNIFVTSDCNQ